MKLHDLTLEERISLKIFISEGYSKSQVANKLGRHRSTIGRELKRWGIEGNLREEIKHYDPELAQWLKRDGKSLSKRFEYKLKRLPKLLKIVIEKLKKRWSPEQISGWLKKSYAGEKNYQISHESIYDYIYRHAKGYLRRVLIKSLRRSKRIRKKLRVKRGKRGQIKGRISIEDRPNSVERREEIGHWEGDLIIGKDRKTAMGTLVERVTRFTIIIPLETRESKEVVKSFSKALNKLPKEYRKTLTYDNGKEMSEHKKFTKLTGMPVYFCHAYSSWERGTNENTNGLIRDFWPKRTDFTTLSRYDIKKVEKLLNERPRAILKWSSPQEIFENELKKSA